MEEKKKILSEEFDITMTDLGIEKSKRSMYAEKLKANELKRIYKEGQVNLRLALLF